MILMLFCLGDFPAAATDKDKEKMMWRGTITMEITERHAYEIEKSDSKAGTWSQRTKNSAIIHTATIDVISADPLGNGDVQVSGPVSSERQIIEQARFRSGCSSSYSIERMEGQASGNLKQGGLVNILFMKKSQIEGAKGIEQAVMNCGADQACLAKIYDRYKSLLEDKSESFPIQMTIQCIPQCTGTGNLTKQMESTDCNGRTKTEEDSGSFQIFCAPMAFEIKDGTYTRGEQGDRITGTFFKNEKIPYTGPDGQIYPREVTARCVVNLTNGPPELKIYMATESGYEDITDKEQDILVGQKVKLAAQVVSAGLGEESDREWKIPGKIVKEWMGSTPESYLRPVKGLKTGTIGFTWYRGKTGGEKRTVRYKVKFGKKTLKAKTHFKVYAPEVSRVDLKPAQSVNFGIGEDGCELFGGNPAMKIESAVKLTGPFSGQRFCLFYVQKTTSNCWGLEKIGFPNYEWQKDVHDWKLDSSFPYNGYKCAVGENRITMMDTPGFPLSSMASAYAHMAFEDYLMFIPPMPKTYGGVCAVPLKKMKWQWSGSAIATGDPFPDSVPPCGQGHRVHCNKPPNGCNPLVNEAEEYPSWEGFVTGAKPTPTRKYTTTRGDPPPSGSGWNCSCGE
ncbi:MAG: hypothetical protein B6I30_01035 [Desulfobacteraceae bacterium 4572_187]|nr:MAG: hypothetical protein B6I30_01035 [Desulfobacteraceae bacterium 4572_187]